MTQSNIKNSYLSRSCISSTKHTYLLHTQCDKYFSLYRPISAACWERTWVQGNYFVLIIPQKDLSPKFRFYRFFFYGFLISFFPLRNQWYLVWVSYQNVFDEIKVCCCTPMVFRCSALCFSDLPISLIQLILWLVFVSLLMFCYSRRVKSRLQSMTWLKISIT